MHPTPKDGVYLKQYQMEGMGAPRHRHRKPAKRHHLMGGAMDSMARPRKVQSNRFAEHVRKPAKTWSALPVRRKRRNEPAVKSFYGVGAKRTTHRRTAHHAHHRGGAWYHDVWHGVKKGAKWAWEHRDQIAKAAQLAAKALGAGRKRKACGGLRRILKRRPVRRTVRAGARRTVSRPANRLMSGMGTFGLGRKRHAKKRHAKK